MMPSQRISESGFIFSRHGTTFLYPLQVRLIGTLHQANLSGTVSVPSDFLVEKLLERGYSRKTIDSEIGRCFYFGTLTRMGVERDDEVRITPFFNLLYPSYMKEISRQENEVLIRVYRRGADRFSLVVRDTSFLSAALRRWLDEQGFKKVPIYELRKSGVTIRGAGRLFHELFDLISDCGRGSSDYRHISESEALILLIEKYGKYYGSIQDKYVHYALPHEYSWQDSLILRSVLAQIRKVARGPLEWRGSPFSQAEIYRSLTRGGDEAPRRVRREDFEQCYLYLQRKLFIRSLGVMNGIEKFTMVGQAEIWIEEFFRTINENYSTLDASILYSGQNEYSIRVANNSFLPNRIRSRFEDLRAEMTEYWIRAENIRGDDLVDLLTDCSLDLTVWRKRNALIRIFSGRG